MWMQCPGSVLRDALPCTILDFVHDQTSILESVVDIQLHDSFQILQGVVFVQNLRNI